MKQEDFKIENLGTCKIKSPLKTRVEAMKRFYFVEEDQQVIFDVIHKEHRSNGSGKDLLFMELAGPREKIYFDPSKTTVAIVTCGGLCPGINDVIRAW